MSHPKLTVRFGRNENGVFGLLNSQVTWITNRAFSQATETGNHATGTVRETDGSNGTEEHHSVPMEYPTNLLQQPLDTKSEKSEFGNKMANETEKDSFGLGGRNLSNNTGNSVPMRESAELPQQPQTVVGNFVTPNDFDENDERWRTVCCTHVKCFTQIYAWAMLALLILTFVILAQWLHCSGYKRYREHKHDDDAHSKGKHHHKHWKHHEHGKHHTHKDRHEDNDAVEIRGDFDSGYTVYNKVQSSTEVEVTQIEEYNEKGELIKVVNVTQYTWTEDVAEYNPFQAPYGYGRSRNAARVALTWCLSLMLSVVLMLHGVSSMKSGFLLPYLILHGLCVVATLAVLILIVIVFLFGHTWYIPSGLITRLGIELTIDIYVLMVIYRTYKYINEKNKAMRLTQNALAQTRTTPIYLLGNSNGYRVHVINSFPGSAPTAMSGDGMHAQTAPPPAYAETVAPPPAYPNLYEEDNNQQAKY